MAQQIPFFFITNHGGHFNSGRLVDPGSAHADLVGHWVGNIHRSFINLDGLALVGCW